MPPGPLTLAGNPGYSLAPPWCSTMSDPIDQTHENLETVDPVDVLNRLSSLPITTWNYKKDDPSIRHIGPMAQDFHAAFQVGDDDKHIHTVDAAGVAFASLQGLHQLYQERGKQLEALRNAVNTAEETLARIEKKA